MLGVLLEHVVPALLGGLHVVLPGGAYVMVVVVRVPSVQCPNIIGSLGRFNFKAFECSNTVVFKL